MRLDLVNMKRLILTNGLKQVTNPILFETGNVPTPDGLLSLEIFGTTSKERKNNFAYIDLHEYFIHPYVYKILMRLDRRIESIVKGTKKYIIDEQGQFVEDEINGKNGCDWLYKNWDKVKFKKNESNVRNERILLLEAYNKDVIFTKYWVVLPAFYRDVNFQNAGSGKLSHNELTTIYVSLLKYANMLEAASEFDFLINSNRGKIQDTLVELYNYFKKKLEKKNGLIRKSLMGKSIDYGVRAVIAAPEFRSNTYDENIVSFTHCALPISLICTLFFPFMLHELRNFFKEQYEMLNYKIDDLSKYNNKLSGSVDLADFDSTYGEDYLKKMMDVFTRSYEDRFMRVEIPTKQPLDYPIYYKITLENEHGEVIERDMTYTDVLFIVANRAAGDKHVYLTRYPITNHLGTIPSKINVSSTLRTQKMSYNGVHYEFYPIVDLNMSKTEVSTFFYDVLKLSNLLLKQFGGDYKQGHYCSL